jgi:hypothetical protein
MKSIVSAVVAVLVLSLLPGVVYSQEVTNVHSSFASNPATGMTISWRSDAPLANPIVEYGITPEYGNQAAGKSLASAGGFSHHATIQGLQPDTIYHYRCAGTTGVGNDCTFKTASLKSDAFSFAVVGDVQGRGPSGLWRGAAAWLAKQKPAFWIPVGDLVQHGLNQDEWDSFFADGKALFESSPVMPLIGNHDCYDNEQKWQVPQLYYDQFQLPGNGNDQFQDSWYSFDYQSAYFSILATYAGQDHQGNKAIIKGLEQAWLDQELAASEAKWKFAFFHPPVYSSGGHGGDTMWLKDYWGKLFDQYHVNAVFTGHTHSFEVTHPIKAGKVVDSTLEGTIYYNTAGVNYSGIPKGDWFTETRQEKGREPFVAIVKVTADTTEISTYNWRDNSLVHTVKLQPGAAK